ncbi:hypothetical protein LA080_012657 [Diaporthe eres]|nr:hypothetical protein LA080_012657 [Diaporthe eres]
MHGKAYCIKGDFLPIAIYDAPYPQLAVTKGELRYAFSDKYTDWRLYQFEDSDRIREGKLAIGASRADPVPIIVPAPLRPPAHSSPAPSTAGYSPRDTLEATLCELWSTVRSNKEHICSLLPLRAAASDEILFGKQSELWPQIIYEAFQPSAIEIMKTGPEQPGIYVICYEDFDGEVNVKIRVVDVDSAVYAGQTIVFQKRDTQHKTHMKSIHSTHYRVARHAGKRTLVPITLFNNTALSEMGIKMGDALNTTELTMVCLFRSWNKALFVESSMQAFSSFATDFTAARLFSALASRVFEKTGWAPLRVLGLNWQTPVILDSPMNRTWVGWLDTTKQMISYRSRRHLIVSKDEDDKKSHATINLGEDNTGQRYSLNMNLEVAEEAGLESGDVIHVIIEIKFNGGYRDHPFMYVPFPRVGRNTEFELLRSMAIRLEWEKNGSWNATYLERMHLWQRESMAKHGGNPPDWLQSLRGRVSIQFLEYNHLAQEARLVNQKETTKIWPPDNNMSLTTDRLRHLFPPTQYPNTLIRPRPPVPAYFRAAVSNSSRTKCNLCYSQSSTRPCKYRMEIEVCEACEILYRPCTWTTGASFNEKMMIGGELSELGLST